MRGFLLKGFLCEFLCPVLCESCVVSIEMEKKILDINVVTWGWKT